MTHSAKNVAICCEAGTTVPGGRKKKERKMVKSDFRGLIQPRPGKSVAILIFSLLTLFLGIGQAQVSTASLNGTVQDNTGAVIPGANVAVVQTQTDFKTETVSGPDGSFRISSIPVGPYVVRVKKDGFARYEQKGIVLTV